MTILLLDSIGRSACNTQILALQLADDVSLENRFVGEVVGVGSSVSLGHGMVLIISLQLWISYKLGLCE